MSRLWYRPLNLMVLNLVFFPQSKPGLQEGSHRVLGEKVGHEPRPHDQRGEEGGKDGEEAEDSYWKISGPDQ